MNGRLVFGVIALTCAARAADAQVVPNDPGGQVLPAESVAILGCRRMVIAEVYKARPYADSVLFTLYPQVFPRSQFETDLRDVGQYLDVVQRLWITFGYGCTYNFQTGAARVVLTWASSSRRNDGPRANPSAPRESDR